jgi:hypothetical protein
MGRYCLNDENLLTAAAHRPLDALGGPGQHAKGGSFSPRKSRVEIIQKWPLLDKEVPIQDKIRVLDTKSCFSLAYLVVLIQC